MFFEKRGLQGDLGFVYFQVAIVMTDGVQTVPDSSSESSTEILDSAVQPVKDKGVEVMSIGIGKGIVLVDLVTLASDDTGVFLAESFAALNEIATDIIEGKCPGIRVTDDVT